MGKNVIIRNSEQAFYYGGCVVIALGTTFGLSIAIIKLIANVLKIKEIEKGATFYDCKKIINVIGSNLGYKVTYYSNVGKVTYFQLALLLDEGKYIVMFDNHLSTLEDGVIVDNYYNEEKIKQLKPTGWWKIS